MNSTSQLTKRKFIAQAAKAMKASLFLALIVSELTIHFYSVNLIKYFVFLNMKRPVIT